ncbi:MAG TPA: DUF1963 domain-containing protein [Gemmataceae bacterium]
MQSAVDRQRLDDLKISHVEIDCEMDLEELMRLQGPTVTFAGLTADSHAGVVFVAARHLLRDMAAACNLDPDSLIGSAVAENWAAIYLRLRPKILSRDQLNQLAKLVAEEYRSLHSQEKQFYKVYRRRHPGRLGLAEQRLGLYRLPNDVREGSEQCDVVWFVDGEPIDRCVTKIGGLPYRPARLAWPTAVDGTPLSFLAQICFAASRDLIGDLPGDVLLVFMPDEPGGISADLYFEWFPLGLKHLIGSEMVSDAVSPFAPYYGFVQRRSESGRSHEGFKIGGIPYWIQSDEYRQERFLGALAGPRWDDRIELPAWRKQTWADDGNPQAREFRPGDAGIYNLFHSGGGKVRFTFQCY